ncbi:ABC transporter substrate-binding protein [Thermococcus profundus]|uniref:ABC transporter substrate-binding protein n=1 Tax=Thermococcus profundus TaxID=49899 RepID=A0A2Z2M8C0_THEPR|nr:zinc ABC transporter substrate-binding protein [Thermococcus profundus]ASJ02720.1 ABC transporter substrate-binding protein [Thermococcus profundus]
MRRALITVAVVIALSGLFIPTTEASEKPLVVASIGPIASIVREAFGDSVDVVTLIPLGADPHEYQLSAEQVNLLRGASVIVTTGGHLPVEAKIAELKEEGVIKAEVLLIDDYRAEGFRYLPERWYNDKDNPHGVWLDPDNALAIARATEKALEGVDPGNADKYRAGFESFRVKVEAIKEAYAGFLEGNKSAVVNMPPVQYAVEWLGIKVVASIKPEEEVPALGVDDLLPTAERSDLVLYSLQSPEQLKKAAFELAEKSGKPTGGVVVFWEGKPYTEILKENTVSVLKAAGEKVIVQKNSGGTDSAYILSALFAGLALGTALGYILKS